MTLRPYQTEAVDRVIAHIRKSTAPCLVEAATGAGKSLCIASLAEKIHSSSGKRVLVMAPSGELVTQNAGKYLATGNFCSIYSASAGRKETRNPVVFASPLTFAPIAKKVGGSYAAIIMDEAHGLTPTMLKIIDEMRAGNPNIRIIGLSATPYRMREGYIYARDERGNSMHPESAYKPFFDKLVYKITADSLIEQGYLCEETIMHPDVLYDASKLKIKQNGRFDEAGLRDAFEGTTKTHEIVGNVVDASSNRNGVMFFGATVRHCQEILECLPRDISAIVSADTPAAERARIIKRYKSGDVKYLVNVSVLTTGFDAPHTDVIAVLRSTESPGLFLQIIGRGMRLSPGKKDFLLIDAADNVARHDNGKGIYRPKIRHRVKDKSQAVIAVSCPSCGDKNQFTARPNESGYTAISPDGYFMLHDIKTAAIAHYGRKCAGCGFMYESKECKKCKALNDISARECAECGELLVDPNDKLVKNKPETMVVKDIKIESTITKAGSECLTATFFGESGHKVKAWFAIPYLERRFRRHQKEGIRSITYGVNESGYPVIYGYNQM